MARKPLSWQDFREIMNEVDKNHRLNHKNKTS